MRRPPQGTVVRWPGLYGDLRANAEQPLVRGRLPARPGAGRTPTPSRAPSTASASRAATSSSGPRCARPSAHARAPRVRLGLWLGAAGSSTAGRRGARPDARPQSLPLAAPLLLLVGVGAVARPLARAAAAPARARARSRLGDRRELRAAWRARRGASSRPSSTAEDNYLPPDNYQREPRGAVAHRTSPTNIGLYLLACRRRARPRLPDAPRGAASASTRPSTPSSASSAATATCSTGTTRARSNRCRPRTSPRSTAATSRPTSGRSSPRVRRAPRRPRPSRRLDAVEDAAARVRRAPRTPRAAPRGRAPPSTRSPTARGGSPRRATPTRATISRRGRAYWRSSALTAAAWSDEARAAAPSPRPSRRLAERARGAAIGCGRAAEALEGASSTRRRSLLDAAAESPEAPSSRGLRESAAGARRAGARARPGRRDELPLPLRRASASSSPSGTTSSNARLDASHYDLLASEARLASLVAIAQGDVPQEHWFRLGRPRAAPRGAGAALLSWSGSMFEFLMPLLVMKRHEGTLLDETYDAVVSRQIAYGREHSVPWGISESAYNLMDLGLTYQYRAFGVPGLGLKAGLGDDLVVAPYATALAAMVRPDLALENFRALAREGAAGPYGFYESIDYTESRLPPGRRGVIVKTFMAHHQAMSLVALCNVLLDAPMPRRFHAHPRVLATELLLEERLPRGVPLLTDRAVPSPPPLPQDGDLHHVEHVTLDDDADLPRAPARPGRARDAPQRARGFGFTTWRGLDVHRFREDAVATDPGGIFVYVRDLERRGAGPSASSPMRAPADDYSVDLRHRPRSSSTAATATSRARWPRWSSRPSTPRTSAASPSPTRAPPPSSSWSPRGSRWPSSSAAPTSRTPRSRGCSSRRASSPRCARSSLTVDRGARGAPGGGSGCVQMPPARERRRRRRRLRGLARALPRSRPHGGRPGGAGPAAATLSGATRASCSTPRWSPCGAPCASRPASARG